MPRPSLTSAALGAAVALGAAAIANALLALLAGDTLVIPGELSVVTVVIFTLVMIVPTALALWLLPRRWFVVLVVAVAVLTLPFPYQEFGTPVAIWLGAMHLIAGICAALIAPRFVRRP
jgi:hypothetical protein